MSDTPRTNKEQFFPHDSKYQVCDADFCRQLERELNEANAEIEEKRKDVVWLATEKAKLENYVMLLEEAGDEMFKWSERVGQEYWMKAKEAKP